MKGFTYGVMRHRIQPTNSDVWLTTCFENGKWRETYARFTETEARSIGDIWVAEQQEMETVAEPIIGTQDTVLVEKMECTFSWLKDVPTGIGEDPLPGFNWAQYYEDLDAQFEQNRADQFAND